MSRSENWGKNIPSEDTNSKCKGHEAGLRRECLRNRKEASVGRLVGDDGGEAAWSPLRIDSVERCESD